MQSDPATIASLFESLGVSFTQVERGLVVTSPCDGAVIGTIPEDTIETIKHKVTRATSAQARWQALPRREREVNLDRLAASIQQHRDVLAQLIVIEAGKTLKEAQGEADGSADVILKTLKDASLPELSGMLRVKERAPLGAIGLITSFNFPLVVGNWTLAPALLAGNAVIWKPSEKTPLTVLAYKAIFDKAMQVHADLLQLLIGGRALGAAMVAHEGVAMISATGSVAMGKAINVSLAKKRRSAKPILELGGNNGVIVSGHVSESHLTWSVEALLNSFFGTSGQRCTNTRRLIVHASWHDRVVALLEAHIEALARSGAIQSPLSGESNPYGYGPLIDQEAYERFEQAKQRVLEDNGRVLFGQRLHEERWPDAYYVEPALALLPTQTPIMFEEVFAPLLFIIPYDGDFSHALDLVNAPANAGLVNGLYTQSRKEADLFAAQNQAGHGVINSPKGTGTPAFGMGFGGNKDSGEGEILNAADPLRPFVRENSYRRVAWNKDVAMDFY